VIVQNSKYYLAHRDLIRISLFVVDTVIRHTIDIPYLVPSLHAQHTHTHTCQFVQLAPRRVSIIVWASMHYLQHHAEAN